MKKLVFFLLVSGILSSSVSFSQKASNDEIAMNTTTSFFSTGTKSTAAPENIYNIHCNVNSDYLTLEVYGLKKITAFEIRDDQGMLIYSGGIVGSQLIETTTWKSGTYYISLGNKTERFNISK